MSEACREEILRLLSNCRACKETRLLGEDCSYLPEALIGSWHPLLAIVGINPGDGVPDPSSVGETYASFYSYRPLWEGNTGWAKGYIKAYKTLIVPKAHPIDEVIGNFNQHGAILNVIKCGTPNVKDISNDSLEAARSNCVQYLLKQLDYMQPKIILSHGRFACNTMLELLRNGNFGDCNTHLIDKLLQMSMGEISGEHVIATRYDKKTLFLFNKHLSYYGPAIRSLNANLEEKVAIIRKIIGQ